MDHTRPRPPLHTSASSNSISRISTVSDMTDFEGCETQEGEVWVRGRPSLVSLPSVASLRSGDSADVPSAGNQADGNTHQNSPAGWSSYNIGYAGPGLVDGGEPRFRTGNLEQLTQARGTPHAHTYGSRTFAQRMSMRRKPQETIPEEDDGLDLSLMNAAAPIGGIEDGTLGGHFNQPFPNPPSGPQGTQEPVFDVTSVLGPSTLDDEAFVKRLQEHESQGILTGGLGQGIRTDATLTESALLSAGAEIRGPRSPVSLARAMSMRVRKPSLGRADTVRQLGQSEANKRGEVIEVILEDEPLAKQHTAKSEVDLSTITPPETISRHGSFPKQKSILVYPQNDWKPFSMRWPYLLFLIILSIGLGGIQEVIYQVSVRRPLVTFRSPSEIPAIDYFAFKFLPTIVTVSYGVFWQATDFNVRRLEAFYQLSKDDGAMAAESINVDYITSLNLFRPLQAFYCKHYAVVVSSIATLLSNVVVPTLGAAAIYLSPDRASRLANPGGEKEMLINPIWSRSLTLTLFIIAGLGCVLFYQLTSRRSGLLADVHGIAGLASMAVVSHILMDFKDMDVANPKDIHHKLKDHRYVLRNGSLAPDDDNPPSKKERDRYGDSYTNNALSQNPHPLMLRAPGAIPYLFGVAGFIALLPVVLFTPASVLTDIAPWVVTALAVCIKLGWSGLDTAVRLIEPYYILSRRHAPPRTLTLDYTTLPFGWVAVCACLNRHWVVALVCFGSVLAEILTVLVTSLATVEGHDFLFAAGIPSSSSSGSTGTAVDGNINSGQETVVSFWFTLGLAGFILLYLLAVGAAAFLGRRRVFLPRQPNTVASVLAFLHQSRMLYDFARTAQMAPAQVARHLEHVGKTYGLGWFRGRDGQPHCGVDEEELLSTYKFGYDYAKATRPWEEEQPW